MYKRDSDIAKLWHNQINVEKRKKNGLHLAYIWAHHILNRHYCLEMDFEIEHCNAQWQRRNFILILFQFYVNQTTATHTIFFHSIFLLHWMRACSSSSSSFTLHFPLYLSLWLYNFIWQRILLFYRGKLTRSSMVFEAFCQMIRIVIFDRNFPVTMNVYYAILVVLTSIQSIMSA